MMMHGFTIFILALQLSVQIFGARLSSGDRWDVLLRSKRETPHRDCTNELQGCLAELIKSVYGYVGAEERSAALSRLGAQKYCEDALPASSCILRKIREEGCEDSGGYEAEAEGYNYMCIEKNEDVQKYWSCLSSFDVIGSYFNCWAIKLSNGKCMNKEQLTECINEKFYLVQNDACGAEAFRFLHAIVEKAFSFHNEC